MSMKPLTPKGNSCPAVSCTCPLVRFFRHPYAWKGWKVHKGRKVHVYDSLLDTHTHTHTLTPKGNRSPAVSCTFPLGQKRFFSHPYAWKGWKIHKGWKVHGHASLLDMSRLWSSICDYGSNSLSVQHEIPKIGIRKSRDQGDFWSSWFFLTWYIQLSPLM